MEILTLESSSIKLTRLFPLTRKATFKSSINTFSLGSLFFIIVMEFSLVAYNPSKIATKILG